MAIGCGHPFAWLSLDHHLDSNGPRRPLGLGDEAGDGQRLLGNLPADELAVAAGAEGADRGEEVDGLQEIRLALGVIADEEQGPRRQVQLQLAIVAKVSEAQVTDIHRLNDRLPHSFVG